MYYTWRNLVETEFIFMFRRTNNVKPCFINCELISKLLTNLSYDYATNYNVYINIIIIIINTYNNIL